jgi:hypothetical protein
MLTVPNSSVNYTVLFTVNIVIIATYITNSNIIIFLRKFLFLILKFSI